MVKSFKYYWKIVKMYYNIWFKKRKNRLDHIYIYEQKRDK